MIQYILEVITFQLVFLIIYDFWLKRETFFQWNRTYLISTYVLAMVLPLVKIEALKTTVPPEYYPYPEFLWSVNDMASIPVTAKATARFSISWEYALLFGGMFLASLFFAHKLRQLYLLKKSEKIQRFTDFTQIVIANSQIAFSFFKSIFMGDKVLEGDYKSVIAHELVHIKQRHSYDLLFFELMRIVCWFNPLVYIYQSRIAELHEFIADAQVAKTNKIAHYQRLLSQVFETQHISFINQFFKSSLIKKRIVMLQKSQSKSVWQLKYLLLVPMVLGMLAYTSAEKELKSLVDAPITLNNDDEMLIAEMRKEIEDEIKGLMAKKETLFNDGSFGNLEDRTKAIIYLHYNLMSESKPAAILTKKEYFKNEIVTKMFFKELSSNFDLQESKIDDFHKKIKLPSTERYESYVGRKEAFYMLDPNLQFSVQAYNQQIGLIDVKTRYSNASLLFEVNNVKDLTGDEMRRFNKSLEKVYENKSTYRDLILTDGVYAFRVHAGMTQLNLDVLDTSDFKGFVNRSDDKITLNVRNLKAMTKGEKEQEQALLEEVKKSAKKDTLLVTDGKSIMQVVPSSKDSLHLTAGRLQTDPIPFAIIDEIPIFPGCENAENKRACFQASMQEHISKHFKYPKQAEEQGIQGRVSIMFLIDEEGNITKIRKRGPEVSLEVEAERIIAKLPQMKPGKHKGEVVKVPFSIPITFKLNSSNEPTDSLANTALFELLERKKLKDIIQDDDTVPFTKVDEVPIFPGCENAEDKRECFKNAILNHVDRNFVYPEEAQKKGIQGRVSVLFFIDQDGEVREILKRGPDAVLEHEAERIMKLLPTMVPGKHQGKIVRVPFSIPISFKLK